MRYLLSLLLLLFIPSCLSSGGPEEPRDIPETMGQWIDFPEGFQPFEAKGRVAMHGLIRSELGSSGHTAHVAACRLDDYSTADPKFYCIEITRPVTENGYQVVARVNIPLDSIPAAIMEKKEEEVVGWDAESRIVTFDLGELKFSHAIPAD